MSEIRDRLRVDVEQLVGRCDPADLPFETTDELPAIEAVFGQERAVRAIEFALGMKSPGYNLYASGPDGIGKTTIVEQFLSRRAAQMPAPPDWVYVHNFADKDRPVGIHLPAGQGRIFAEQVARAVDAASHELRQAFESDSYARQRSEFQQRLEQSRAQLLEKLSERAREMGFQLQMTPQGINSAPLVDGEPASDEVFQALPTEQRETIQQSAEELERVVQDSMLELRALEREVQEELRHLDEQVATFAIEHLFEPLIGAHGDVPEIVQFLEGVRDDIRSERDSFREQPQQAPSAPLPQPQGPNLRKYEVNVAISNDPQGGAPVIIERHPTYYNLLGRIEYVGQFGTMVTDHTMIKAGSLAQASGGFLVLRLRDLLPNTVVYDGLKRALSSGEFAVENLGDAFGLVPTSALRPEPMPLDAKVVIVGDPALYGMLFRLDPDFRELFRVKADFEVDFERTRENIRGIASLIRNQCEQGNMRCFSKEAVARLVEHSSRMVEDQRRLSANMGAFLDLVRQADYWATQDGSATVTAQHVERALEEREYRSSLVRDRLQQMIDDGSILIDTEGGKVGQINALSIYDLGDVAFGRPSRVTTVVSPGRGTIVNIERETNMAGRIHNKGFLIMRGFLTGSFGQDKAMAMHASLTFEQLYGDIDGDSASSTELYALLSALADVPIDQALAVTGSVNQRGEVQPIGGATAKIEGFYEVCRARGLTGQQGVMIPRANVPNVTLRPDVAQAIEEGRFHVWAVESIEEGIEVLTGMSAGTRQEDGQYPEGTLFRMVEDRLDQFYHAIAEHREAGGGEAPAIVAPPAPPTPVPGIPPLPPPDPPIIVQGG